MSEQAKPDKIKPSFNQKLKHWAKKLKDDIIALYYAIKHSQTPLYAKAITAIVVGYALSPIDLIPDFIPIFGYLDDVILLPLGIAMVIKLIPYEVLQSCREEAANNPPAMKPKLWIAAYVIVAIWILVLYGIYIVSNKDVQACC
ncbi:hypothetical protein SCACP_00080 [Sporomusa carbonis]|uniref:YkvA family protein n=1 Tax=Sporomusa carbonis TaxID=3076075 RepID=UPI003A62F4E0